MAGRGNRTQGTPAADVLIISSKDTAFKGSNLDSLLTVNSAEGATAGVEMLEVLSNFNPHPESVPINALMPMKGTPLGENVQVDSFSLVRMIAVTRIAIPRAKVRLSAGRTNLSREAQALAFFAGANSIFYGDKLLTAANPRANEDLALLHELGLSAQQPNPNMEAPLADEVRELAPATCSLAGCGA
jgi:biotin synthase